MKDKFTRNTGIVAVLSLGLLLLNRLPPLMGNTKGAGRLRFVIAELYNADLNANDFVTRANGYYEGIQHTVRIAPGAENDDYRLRDDFLRYEFRANVNRVYGAGR